MVLHLKPIEHKGTEGFARVCWNIHEKIMFGNNSRLSFHYTKAFSPRTQYALQSVIPISQIGKQTQNGDEMSCPCMLVQPAHDKAMTSLLPVHCFRLVRRPGSREVKSAHLFSLSKLSESQKVNSKTEKQN